MTDKNGLSTGLVTLDKVIGGLLPGQLIVIGGCPAVGKTTLALGMAGHLCSKPEYVSAIFSLEHIKEQVGLRLVGQLAAAQPIPSRQAGLDRTLWSRFSDATNTLSKSRLFIDDTPALSAADLFSRCQQVRAHEGRLDLIVVDYIQLMSHVQKEPMTADIRKRQLSQSYRSLKNIANKLNCPVVVLSRLSPGVERRTEGRPTLKDMEESCVDADIIIFMYRDKESKDFAGSGNIELSIEKNSAGGTGIVKVGFRSGVPRFVDLDE